MVPQLYDKFSSWAEKGTLWAISDTHFGDDELHSGMAHRPDDLELLHNINSKVGKNDTLIHLGDVGDVEYARKLKGYKVLICGNHDAGGTVYKRQIVKAKFDTDKYTVKQALEEMQEKYPGWTVHYEVGHDVCHSPFEYYLVTADNRLFDEVYTGPLMIGERVLLSHEPIQQNFALNIHGHVHDIRHSNDNFHYNFCCDCTGYMPINMNQFLKSGVLSGIANYHRETIDRATDRKRKRLDRTYK